MKKIILTVLALGLFFTAYAQTASDLKSKFTGNLENFLGDINKNLPDSAVSGGTWSDAYIGQLIGLPPHFGIGVSCGFSRFPIQSLMDAAEQVGASIDTPGWLGKDSIPAINPAVELRIGGFMLPFDAGMRFSMLSLKNFFNLDIKYLSFSFDARYAIIQETVILPDLIVGLGWYYVSGDINYDFNADSLADKAGFTIPASANKTEKLSVDFKTNVFEARVQLSKSLLIFTPYLGLTGYYAMSESSYDIVDESKTLKDSYFGSRIYGGLSFNITFIKLDLSGSYNFITGNWGGNIGARFQL